MAVVMDTMAILMAMTMVTGIVIIVIQGAALAMGDETKEHVCVTFCDILKNKQKGLQVVESFCNPLILFWRRHPDLNRRITVLQTVALPLGYAALGAGNGI